MTRNADRAGSAFPCPCGHDRAATTDSRLSTQAIRRRRRCIACGLKFTTYETVADLGKGAERARLHDVQADLRKLGNTLLVAQDMIVGLLEEGA